MELYIFVIVYKSLEKDGEKKTPQRVSLATRLPGSVCGPQPRASRFRAESLKVGHSYTFI